MMDAMARARTLGVIVDRMAALAEQSSRPPGGSGQSHAIPNSIDDQLSERQRQASIDEATGSVRRPEVVDAPLPRERLGLMPQGRIVITDDGRGVAR